VARAAWRGLIVVAQWPGPPHDGFAGKACGSSATAFDRPAVA